MKKTEKEPAKNTLHRILLLINLIKIVFTLYMIFETIISIIIPLVVNPQFATEIPVLIMLVLKDFGLLCLAWALPSYPQMVLQLLWASHTN